MSCYRLVIYTQYEENYGAHDWEGEGECPQYWKMKGGGDYVAASFTVTELAAMAPLGVQKTLGEKAQAFAKTVAKDNHYSREYMIGWDLLEPHEKTETEQYAELADEMREARHAESNAYAGIR